MLRDYIQQRQKVIEEMGNFYTPSGIQVYSKDLMIGGEVDMDKVVSKFESLIPAHVRNEVEMIIVGHFEEFEDRQINAFYKDGTLHISNVQNDSEDLLDDLVHETAHSLEESQGHFIYGDQKLEKEFLRKREFLYNILWKMGFKAPHEMFLDTEYDQEFDEFLLQDVGYDKLAEVLRGIFVTPYAATSLREYFATGFTEFYLYPDSHGYLQKVSPELYKKLVQLHRAD
jgi:hypothetical protein